MAVFLFVPITLRCVWSLMAQPRKCVQTSTRVGNSKSGVMSKIGNASLRNRTTATGTRINRGGTAPVKFRAPNSDHVRIGRHH